MDANLVYRKTPAGEEAVRQRTRVVQRNTRMVLILVDGKSTVGDLCEKTGNQQLVESALADLERDGLVSTAVAEDPDSLWDQGRKAAEDIRKAAVERLKEAPEPPAAASGSDREPAAPAAVPPPVVHQVSLEPFSIGPASISPHSAYPGPTSRGPQSAFGREAKAEAPPPDVDDDQGGPVRGVADRLVRGDDEIKPIRRGPRRYVSPALAVALGVAGLLVLGALVFVLYPYDRHRPALEAALGQLLGEPVAVASIDASFSPRPAIVLSAVRAGDGEALRAARIRLVPELFSLFGSQPSFSRVEVEGAVFDGKALRLLPKALAAIGRQEAPARIGVLAFSRLHLSLLGLGVEDLQTEFTLSEGLPESGFSFTSPDRSLRVLLRAEESALAGEFEGYAWQPAGDPRYRFASLQGRFGWNGAVLTVAALDARIFDGAIQGALQLVHDDQARLAGDLTVKHMNLPALAAALGYPEQFEGELSGALRFSGSAPAWSGIFPALSGEGEVLAQRVVLGGFDFVEAVRRAGRGAVAGGSTRFEQLKAGLSLSPTAVGLVDIDAASGLLRTGGGLSVARDGKLSGRLDVEMRGSAAVVRRPVMLDGTLKNPELRAAR